MQLRPNDFDYRAPRERGYRVPGAKLAPADPYDTKAFHRYIAEGNPPEPGCRRVKRKYLRIAVRNIRLGLSARGHRKEVRFLMLDYYGQEFRGVRAG